VQGESSSGAFDGATAVAIQADGKIVAAGGDTGVVRFNPDGTPHDTFDDGGLVVFDVAIQPSDQKVVVAGSETRDGDVDFAVARYNPDGTPDASFGGGDGKVVIQFAETPETSNNTGDLNLDEAAAVAIQSDGDIVAAGTADPTTPGPARDFAVARFDPDGTLDNGFGGDGKVTQTIQGSDFGHDLVLLPGNKIVVVGSTQGDAAIARFLPNGEPDPTFDENGVIGIDFGGVSELFGVALQPDGKAVAVGRTGDLTIVTRRNTDGSPDSSFHNDGNITGQFSGNAQWNDVAIQTNGSIVAAGFTDTFYGPDFAVGRFLPSGEPDSLFSCVGAVTTNFGSRYSGSNDQVEGLALDGNGQIVVAGSAELNVGLARYLASGPGADCVAPETTIKGPKKTKNERPAFKLRSDEPGSTFVCVLDRKRKFSDCSPNYKPPKRLRRGKHTLTAVATDAAGNADATPAVKKFTVLGGK